MTNDPKIKFAFDMTKRQPGCVLIQAALGCDNHIVGKLFDAKKWLVSFTPDMKIYELPLSELKKVAEKINSEI